MRGMRPVAKACWRRPGLLRVIGGGGEGDGEGDGVFLGRSMGPTGERNPTVTASRTHQWNAGEIGRAHV